jgi:hypothetical protein
VGPATVRAGGEAPAQGLGREAHTVRVFEERTVADAQRGVVEQALAEPRVGPGAQQPPRAQRQRRQAAARRGVVGGGDEVVHQELVGPGTGVQDAGVPMQQQGMGRRHVGMQPAHHEVGHLGRVLQRPGIDHLQPRQHHRGQPAVGEQQHATECHAPAGLHQGRCGQRRHAALDGAERHLRQRRSVHGAGCCQRRMPRRSRSS